MSKLTALQIRNAKVQNKPYKLSDGHGMHLYISPTGKKSWRYRYKILGKESTYTLGEFPQMSLEQARKARTDARELVKSGQNPAVKRRVKKQAQMDLEDLARDVSKNTFEFVALDWIGVQRGRWSKNHADAVLAIQTLARQLR